MSDTPRTDAAWHSITVSAPWDAAAEQMAQHAKDLERELAAERAIADRLAESVEQVLSSLKLNKGEGIGIGPKMKSKSALAAWKEVRRDY